MVIYGSHNPCFCQHTACRASYFGCLLFCLFLIFTFFSKTTAILQQLKYEVSNSNTIKYCRSTEQYGVQVLVVVVLCISEIVLVRYNWSQYSTADVGGGSTYNSRQIDGQIVVVYIYVFSLCQWMSYYNWTSQNNSIYVCV